MSRKYQPANASNASKLKKIWKAATSVDLWFICWSVRRPPTERSVWVRRSHRVRGYRWEWSKSIILASCFVSLLFSAFLYRSCLKQWVLVKYDARGCIMDKMLVILINMLTIIPRLTCTGRNISLCCHEDYHNPVCVFAVDVHNFSQK